MLRDVLAEKPNICTTSVNIFCNLCAMLPAAGSCSSPFCGSFAEHLLLMLLLLSYAANRLQEKLFLCLWARPSRL
jgi:hypothetical protein